MLNDLKTWPLMVEILDEMVGNYINYEKDYIKNTVKNGERISIGNVNSQPDENLK